jgi:hypothetical protein
MWRMQQRQRQRQWRRHNLLFRQVQRLSHCVDVQALLNQEPRLDCRNARKGLRAAPVTEQGWSGQAEAGRRQGSRQVAWLPVKLLFCLCLVPHSHVCCTACCTECRRAAGELTQQLPQLPWFLMGVTLPLARQSTMGGRGACSRRREAFFAALRGQHACTCCKAMGYEEALGSNLLPLPLPLPLPLLLLQGCSCSRRRAYRERALAASGLAAAVAVAAAGRAEAGRLPRWNLPGSAIRVSGHIAGWQVHQHLGFKRLLGQVREYCQGCRHGQSQQGAQSRQACLVSGCAGRGRTQTAALRQMQGAAKAPGRDLLAARALVSVQPLKLVGAVQVGVALQWHQAGAHLRCSWSWLSWRA